MESCTLPGHEGFAYSVAWSPEGGQLTVGTFSFLGSVGKIVVCNVQFAQILRRTLRKNQTRCLRSVQPNAELAEVRSHKRVTAYAVCWSLEQGQC